MNQRYDETETVKMNTNLQYIYITPPTRPLEYREWEFTVITATISPKMLDMFGSDIDQLLKTNGKSNPEKWKTKRRDIRKYCEFYIKVKS